MCVIPGSTKRPRNDGLRENDIDLQLSARPSKLMILVWFSDFEIGNETSIHE
jgi:hypothetical protein